MSNIVEKYKKRLAGEKESASAALKNTSNQAANGNGATGKISIVEKYKTRMRLGINSYNPEQRGQTSLDDVSKWMDSGSDTLYKLAQEYAGIEGQYRTREEQLAMNREANDQLIALTMGARPARNYLYENANLYSDDVLDQLAKSIQDWETGREELRQRGIKESKYWGQFAHERDYAKQMEDWEKQLRLAAEEAADREEKLGMDIPAAEALLEAHRKELDELNSVQIPVQRGAYIYDPATQMPVIPVPPEHQDKARREETPADTGTLRYDGYIHDPSTGMPMTPIPKEHQADEAEAARADAADTADYTDEDWAALIERQNFLRGEIKKTESDLPKARRYQKAASYSALLEDQDFVQAAAFDPEVDDKLYRYIGGDKTLTALMESSRYRPMAYNEDWNKYSVMTDDERTIYAGVYNREGKAAAEEYLEAISFDLNRRYAEQEMNRWREFAMERPVLASVSTVLDTFGKPLGYLYAIERQLKGMEIDPYDPAFASSINQAIKRATVAGEIDKSVDAEWASTVLQFLYNTGMSIADFGMLSLTMGSFGVAGEAAQLAIMGMGSAADTTRDVILRGGTQQQAMQMGTLAGIYEMLFEKVSLDHFITLTDKAAKGAFVKNLLKQAGIEASEEFFTEIAGVLTDELVMGELSNYNTLVAEYKRKGQSEEEAQKVARMSIAKDIAWAAAGGALSGGTMGGIGGVAGMINTAQVGRDLNAAGVARDVVQSGMQTVDVRALARQLAEENQRRLDSGKAVGNLALGRQHMANIEAINAETLATVGARVDSETAQIFADILGGERISKQAAQRILDDAAARDLFSELVSPIPSDTTAARLVQLAREGEGASFAALEIDGGEAAEADPLRAAALEAADAAAMPADTPRETAEGTFDTSRAQAAFADSDAPVTVLGVTRVTEDGRMLVRLEDGGTADARDLRFQDADAADLYRAAPRFGQQGAQAFVSNYAASRASVAAYVRAFDQFYRGGRVGLPFEQYQAGDFARFLSPAAQRAAYEAGKADKAADRDSKFEKKPQAAGETFPQVAEAREEKKAKAKRDGQEGKTADRKPDAGKGEKTEKRAEGKNDSPETAARKRAPGVNREDGGKPLDRRMQAELDMLDTMAKLRGVVVVLEDGLERVDMVDGQPVLRSANGLYDPRTGEIHIDVNAVEGGLLFVGTHELTHFVRDMSPEYYEVLREYVLSEVQRLDPGYDLEARVEALRKRQPELTREGALEEIVADAVPAIWTDAETVERFVSEHRTLAEKIRDFLRELVADIRAALARIAGQGRPEIEALSQDADTLRNIAALFDDALTIAGEAYSTGIRIGDMAKYSAEMRDTIAEYTAAVDAELLAAAEAYRETNRQVFLRLDVAPVSERATKAIDALLGVDVSGYRHMVNGDTLAHIENRHGIQGQHDKSMTDLHDVARLPYILENYDSVEILRDENGKQVFSAAYKDRNNRLAPLVLYKKRINGTYYIAEAVVDTKSKRLWVITAYINKNAGDELASSPALEGMQVPGTQAGSPSEDLLANSPSDRALRASGTEAPDVSASLPTDSIPDTDAKNNTPRFSLKEGEQVGSYFTQEKTADQAADTLQQAYARVRANGGVELNRQAAEKMAKTLLKEAGSAYDAGTLAAELNGIFQAVAAVQGEINWHAVWGELTGLAESVVAASGRLDTTMYDDYKDMREYFRATPIALSDTQKAEVAAAHDSYEDFRRLNWGRLRLRDDGTTLDQVWNEISDRWPGLFRADTAEGDQPAALADALDAVRKVYVADSYDTDTAAASHDLALTMFDQYLEATEAGRVDAEARRLRETARERMKKYRDDLETKYRKRFDAFRKQQIQERADLAKRMTQAHGEELAALRERMREMVSRKHQALEAQRQEFREWKRADRSKRLAREEARKYKERISKTAKELHTWLQHPTDAKHVPELLRGTVTNFLLSLDFSTERKNVYGETPRRVADWQNAMLLLEGQIRQMESGNLEALNFYADVDPDLAGTIEAFVAAAKTVHRIEDLDAAQLKELSFIVDSVKRTIQKANTLHANARYQQVEALAEASMEEMGKRKAKRGGNKFTDMLNIDQLDAFSYFEELGGTSETVLEALRLGFDKKVRNVDTAMRFMKGLLKGVNTKAWTGDRAAPHTFDLPGGTLRLTTGQIMELYALSKREQALGHIFGGGVRAAETRQRVGKGIKRIVQNQQVEPVMLTPEDLAKITGTLTAEQKRVADAMQGFLGEVAGGWGNEVSLELYGYKKFTEKNYYPIKSDENYTATREPDKQGNIAQLKNLGMTKATIKGANNPLIVSDIFDTFTRHVDEMATYNGLVVPLSDAMKWFNYRSRSGEITGGPAYLGSVKQSVTRVLGAKGRQYFVNLISDINGIPGGSYGTELLGKLVSNAKVAAVGANLRVVLQQPTAYLRAAAMISPKYLTRAMFMIPKVKMAQQYAPIALWKSWGFFETNLGTTMRNVIVGDGTLAESIREKSLWLAGKADDATWGALWNACALEVAETRPDLRQGTEAFHEAVGRRLSEVVDRTQVVDTVFHRSQAMRSKDSLAKLYTSFMAEPTKSYNMLRGAIMNAVRNNTPEARAKLLRVSVTYVATAALTAAAASIADAFRDEDDEKNWFEKYRKALFGYGEDWREILGSNLLSGVNPLYLVPFTKEIMSLLDGYSPSRLDMDGIEALYNAANGWLKYINGESKWSAYKLISQSVKAISRTFGVPAGGMLRTFESLYNTFSSTRIQWEHETSTMAKTYQVMAQALRDGDKAKYNRLRSALVEAEKTYAQIDAGMRAALVGDDDTPGDPRIEEAAKARIALNTGAYERIVREMKAEGFKQDVVVGAINNVVTKLTKEKKEKGNVDEDNTDPLYLYDDLERAITANNAATVDRIVESLVQSGKKEENIKSAVTERIRPVYMEYTEKGNAAAAQKLEALLSDRFGYDADDYARWLDPKPYAELDAALEGGDLSQITYEIGALLEEGKDIGAIKSRVTEQYKPAYLESYYAGDSQGMAVISQSLMQLGYVSYEKNTFRDWIRTDLRGGLYDAIEEGDYQTADLYRRQLLAEGVKANSILNSLENKYKPIFAGYYRAGNLEKLQSLQNMLLALGMSAGRMAKWVQQ